MPTRMHIYVEPACVYSRMVSDVHAQVDELAHRHTHLWNSLQHARSECKRCGANGPREADSDRDSEVTRQLPNKCSRRVPGSPPGDLRGCPKLLISRSGRRPDLGRPWPTLGPFLTNLGQTRPKCDANRPLWVCPHHYGHFANMGKHLRLSAPFWRNVPMTWPTRSELDPFKELWVWSSPSSETPQTS